MLDRLLKMEVDDLRDLLAVVAEDSHAGHGVHEPAELVGRIEAQLRELLGVDAGAERAALEARLVGEVASAMGLDLPEGDADLQLQALYEHISSRVASELEPLFRVAVNMGWADGEFTEDELLLVRSGVGKLRISEGQRETLCRITELGKTSTRELLAVTAEAAGSPDRRRAMLSFAWAVAMTDGRQDPGELRFFEQLAEHLGVPAEEADTLRRAVTVRYEEAREWASREVRQARPEAVAALAALVASGLDDYLVSATGVIGLSMLLGVPVSLHGTAALLAPAGHVGEREEGGTPGLVAGTLLLRGLRDRPALQRSLAVLLAAL